MEPGTSFAKVAFEGGELFERVGRTLGVTGFGLNAITLQPRQRLRIHRHGTQEEVYLVLHGTLTLTIEGEEHPLRVGEIARVAPDVKRQVVNRGPDVCVVLAIGGSGSHESRDAEAFTAWDEPTGRAPQEVALPDDLPA